jgi:sensor histidine kinase YesM
MISVLKKNISLIIKAIVIVSILVPLVIVTYETLILGKESVVFLQNFPTIIGVIVLIYYSLLLAMGLFLLMKQLLAVLSLKNETKKNELLHLQSQVNPHFFFNMLNNLYGMVDKDTE